MSGEIGVIATISGDIDKTNKTWSFEDEYGIRFKAALLNGNMVNGTGYQSDVDAGLFTFTATATD